MPQSRNYIAKNYRLHHQWGVLIATQEYNFSATAPNGKHSIWSKNMFTKLIILSFLGQYKTYHTFERSNVNHKCVV